MATIRPVLFCTFTLTLKEKLESLHKCIDAVEPLQWSHCQNTLWTQEVHYYNCFIECVLHLLCLLFPSQVHGTRICFQYAVHTVCVQSITYLSWVILEEGSDGTDVPSSRGSHYYLWTGLFHERLQLSLHQRRQVDLI